MTTASEPGMQQVQANARGAKGWLKFMGIVSIVGGAMYALTLVGIVVAWMPIWIGVLMYQAGGRAGEFADRGDPQALAGYTAKLRSLFTIMGVVTIISLALGVVSAIIGVIMAISGVALPSLLEQFGYGS